MTVYDTSTGTACGAVVTPGFSFSSAVSLAARGTKVITTFAAVPFFSFSSAAFIAATNVYTKAATTAAAVLRFNVSSAVPLSAGDTKTAINAATTAFRLALRLLHIFNFNHKKDY